METEGGRGESERENDKKRCACGSLPTRVKPYKKVDNFAHVNASIRMQGVSISENANYLFGYKRTRPEVEVRLNRDFCATYGFTLARHTFKRGGTA